MKVFHFGAEYHYRPGEENPPMGALMRRVEAGEIFPDHDYFRRTKSQVETALAILGLPNTSIHYGDVTQVKAEGKHTAFDEYRRRVLQTRDAVVAEFAELNPCAAIIAGGDAFRAFRDIVHPALGASQPAVVIKVRNPGAEGHRGRFKAWETAYADAAAAFSGKLKEGVVPGRPTRFYSLVSSGVTDGLAAAFRLVELRARR